MPETTTDEVDPFAADLEKADCLSHASLVFRYARAMAAGRALWGSRRDWQEQARSKRAEHAETLGMLEHAYAVIERDASRIAALESQLNVANARIAGHRDGAAAARRALDDVHADLRAARERVAELEQQVQTGVASFVDELPAKPPRKDINPVMDVFAAQLRGRPGKWAEWPEHLRKGTAQNYGCQIRKGLMRAFRGGGFDAETRQGRLYVRYVGEDGDR